VKAAPSLNLHIVHLVHTLNPGGAERLAADMAVALQPAFCVGIVCLDEPGLWAGRMREQGVPVFCLYRQPGLDLRLGGKLARFLRDRCVRVVHAHQTTPWFYAGLARLLGASARILFEEHGRHYPEVRKPGKALFNRVILQPMTARFVAVSADVKERLVRFEGISRDRIQIVYNGAHPPPTLSRQDRQDLRRQLGFSSDDFLVGTVGRFDSVKNLPMLLQALHEARRQRPTLKALLVGDGPEFPRVQKLVEKLGLGNAVHLTGYRYDADRLTACMDLFVLSSFSEGTSMALLQAMGSGVPAAVTRVGGNPEIVEEGETGWVIESDDAPMLARVLVEASCAPEELRRRGVAARQRFESRFTFTRMMEQYETIYRELL